MAQVRTRKRGKTYSYIFEAGQVNGKRKVVEKGGFATKDAAYEAGVAAFTDWKHGNIGIASERVTLSEFSTLWQTRKAKDIRVNTRSSYKYIVSSKIIPYIGHYLIRDLTPAIIEGWITNLFNAGFSKGYIKECRMVLKSILDYAVYPGGLISFNPCLYIKVPKNAPTGIVKRVIISGVDYSELMKSYPPGHDMRVPVALFYHTGMRLGEVLGLTWDDIDFEQQTITINKQRIYSREGSIKEKLDETKTEKSNRKIYVNDELLRELRQERIRQQEQEQGLDIGVFMDAEGYCYVLSKSFALASKELTPVHLVCLTKRGRPTNRTTLSKCLRESGLNSHSFRHTQATRLAKAKVPPMTAARRLGHSNVDITLNLYTHDSDDMQKSAMEALK